MAEKSLLGRGVILTPELGQRRQEASAGPSPSSRTKLLGLNLPSCLEQRNAGSACVQSSGDRQHGTVITERRKIRAVRPPRLALALRVALPGWPRSELRAAEVARD